MSVENMELGDLIEFVSEERAGIVGIVSQPSGVQGVGHVLICDDERILGVAASAEDVKPADESSEGFAQLGYNLVKLGSHVIERGLRPLTEGLLRGLAGVQHDNHPVVNRSASTAHRKEER